MLIDSHCHLDGRAFADGAEAALDRAREAGVAACLVVGVSGVEIAQWVIALSEQRSDVVVAIGVHPHDAESAGAQLEELEPLVDHPAVVALGEVGLDFYYDHSPREAQADVFRRSVRLARRKHKPLVIHSRSAPAETLQILDQEGASEVGGVIHCFSEDWRFAERALELGFDLAFSGIVTFKTAAAIQEVARRAPLERILVETDSPYLTPVPLRGRIRRCEPAFVVHTVQFLARLRGLDAEAFGQITAENACRRFGPALSRAAGLTAR